MIKKTALLLIGVVMSVSVLAAGCTFNVGNTTPSASPTNTYDSVKGFTIKYSSDWGKPQEQRNGALVVFLTPTNNETENLNVEVANLSASSTLATVTETIKSNAQDYDNFTQIEATNTTLAGLPAYKIVYTATVDGDQLKVLQTWTVKDGKAYVITYKAAPSNYNTHVSAAHQMIDSFQIK
ncbi:MAG: PsbP-related protein [Halobacteriota archaeon]